jgi:hypothetical protein
VAIFILNITLVNFIVFTDQNKLNNKSKKT